MTGRDETEPSPDCPRCARLVAYRRENRLRFPGFHNAPVPSLGAARPVLLILGLAPALKGGNRTGLPFVGDVPGGSGHFLSAALERAGLGEGCGIPIRVTNAVRCVPPGNRPLPEERRNCAPFLSAEVALRRPRVALALGAFAHEALLRALGLRPGGFAFAHAARHEPPGLVLFDCYHPSRQNTQTGRLTPAMMDALLTRVRIECEGAGGG